MPFQASALHGDSALLKAADRLLYILAAYQARVFVIWTTHPDLLTLRHAAIVVSQAPDSGDPAPWACPVRATLSASWCARPVR